MANNYRVPPFLKRDKQALLYNGDGQLMYVIPEEYFTARVAEEYGSYYVLIGMFNYVQVNKNGTKIGKTRPFNFPTKFMCRPSFTEKKISGVELNKKFGGFEDDVEYRLLIFNNGNLQIPKTMDDNWSNPEIETLSNVWVVSSTNIDETDI